MPPVLPRPVALLVLAGLALPGCVTTNDCPPTKTRVCKGNDCRCGVTCDTGRECLLGETCAKSSLDGSTTTKGGCVDGAWAGLTPVCSPSCLEEEHCTYAGGSPACVPACRAATDCATRCCFRLNDGADVCADADYCTEEHNPCDPTCGSDEMCVSGQGCLPLCTYDTDCATHCCRPTSNGAAVCSPSSYCGGGSSGGPTCHDATDCLTKQVTQGQSAGCLSLYIVNGCGRTVECGLCGVDGAGACMGPWRGTWLFYEGSDRQYNEASVCVDGAVGVQSRCAWETDGASCKQLP